MNTKARYAGWLIVGCIAALFALSVWAQGPHDGPDAVRRVDAEVKAKAPEPPADGPRVSPTKDAAGRPRRAWRDEDDARRGYGPGPRAWRDEDDAKRGYGPGPRAWRDEDDAKRGYGPGPRAWRDEDDAKRGYGPGPRAWRDLEW